MPASNNHILNSALMRVSTRVFGLSHLSMRAPALAGALLYITASYLLCRLLMRRRWDQLLLFVSLVGSPFVFDYLVAARGYGMAAGFLLLAFYVAARRELAASRQDDPAPAYVAVSVLLALCVAANFAFALACVTTLAVVIARAMRREPRPVRAIVAATAPALLVSIFLTLHAALNMPKSQLWYGAKSIWEMLISFRRAVFPKANTDLVNPLIAPAVEWIRSWMHTIVLVPGLTLTAILLVRWKTVVDVRARVAAAAVIIAAATMIVHYVAFLFGIILLPLDRTGLWFILLLTLAFPIGASLETRSRTVRTAQTLTKAALVIACVYFALTLRLSYFTQWEWGAETRQAYDVVAWYSNEYGVRKVPASWHYVPSLNFYRRMWARQPLQFHDRAKNAASDGVYVLHGAFDAKFIAEKRLQIVWRGGFTEIQIAVDPSIATRPQPSPTASGRS
jgi:hypothetical protein